jgi:hypothetical protein
LISTGPSLIDQSSALTATKGYLKLALFMPAV